jgi:hypothetical protein
MRYILCVLALLFVVSFGKTAQAQTVAPGEFCNSIGDGGLTHDTCVAIVLSEQNPNVNGNVAACKVLRDSGELQLAGFKNLGDCISSMPEDFGPDSLSAGVFGFLLAGWAAFQLLRMRRRNVVCQS